MRLTTKQY